MIYRFSETGRFARDFGLRDQMRRAAVSIMSNIAEGFESRTRLLFVEFLGRAKASCAELRAQIYVALDVGYLTQEQFTQVMQVAEKSGRQIYGFMQYLKQQGMQIFKFQLSTFGTSRRWRSVPSRDNLQQKK